MTVTHTQHHTETLPTKTVTVPAPANTRVVASPAPQYSASSSATTFIPRTTAVEVVVEEVLDVPTPVGVDVEPEEDEYFEDDFVRPVKVKGGRRRQPKGWFSW